MTGENTGLVQTVLGAVHPDELGSNAYARASPDRPGVSPRAAQRGPSSGRSTTGPLTLETVGYLKHYGYANRDDVQLLDIETAIEEIGLYKQHGGVSVVDATSIGISRDPVGLSRIARATGLNIIMGSSYYVGSSHPPDMSDGRRTRSSRRVFEDVTVVSTAPGSGQGS